MPENVEEVTWDTPFLPDDDCYHPPGSNAGNWTETTWWSFNVPQRRIGGWLHAAYHANRGTVTWRVFVWDPTASDNTRLAYFRIAEEKPMPADPDLRSVTFPSGGFSVKMLQPCLEYEVSYVDEAAGFAVDLNFLGAHHPRRYTPGEPPAMFSPHFDQLCHVTGTMRLHGESIDIDCYSIRDRTWGPRGIDPCAAKNSVPARPAADASAVVRGPVPDLARVKLPGGPAWRQIEREGGRNRIEYIFGHDDARTGFLSFVRVSAGDAQGWFPLNVGWLLLDGTFEHLDKSKSRMRNFRSPETGWNTHFEVDLVDIAGRTLRAEGTALSYQSETGAGNNALVRWDFGGSIGWGEDQDIWAPSHFKRMLLAMRTIH